MSVSDKYLKGRSLSQKIRVMIVDDSVVVRGMFSKWLEEVNDIEVIAVHRNGLLAVNNIANDNPDVVLLDIEMPEMDGITALPLLLENCPSTKVIISSTLTTRNAEISLRAMALGAVDYVAKPQGSGGLTGASEFKAELIQKIRVFGGVVNPIEAGPAGAVNFKASTAAKMGFSASSAVRPSFSGSSASQSRVVRPVGFKKPLKESSSSDNKPFKIGEAKPTGKPQVERAATSAKQTIARSNPSAVSRATKAPGEEAQLHRFSKTLPKIIVIGASTGGPPALLEVTKAINDDVDHLPVLITQHMPASFTAILAQHIAKATGRECKEGEHGEEVRNGVIYVAPGGKHMSLSGSGFSVKIHLDDGPQINYCKPSVDPLFESAAKIFKKAVLSVILTGMGNDGTGGAEKIISQGGSVIVQDEESSVVWGMPGSAAQEGFVCEILPLQNIGRRVSSLIKGKVL